MLDGRVGSGASGLTTRFPYVPDHDVTREVVQDLEQEIPAQVGRTEIRKIDLPQLIHRACRTLEAIRMRLSEDRLT